MAIKSVETITSEEIQNALNSLKDYSESTINKVTGLLKQGFSYSHNKGYITTNPMIDVIKPKSTKQTKIVRALTLEEQQQFTNYLVNVPLADEPFKVAYLLEMYLGLRVGEALAIRNCDIDLENGLVSVNKTLTINRQGKTIMGDTTKSYAGLREVPIPPFIKNELIPQMKLAEKHKDNLLFVDTKGGLMNPKNENRKLKHTLKMMGINDISTHTLRHTYATRCIEAGMRAVALKNLMGHKNIEITLNTYTSIFDKYKNEELSKVNDYYQDNDIVYNRNFRLLKGNKKDTNNKEDLYIV